VLFFIAISFAHRMRLDLFHSLSSQAEQSVSGINGSSSSPFVLYCLETLEIGEHWKDATGGRKSEADQAREAILTSIEIT